MDHPVVHFEIPADDPERAVRFYRELFGWKIDHWSPPGGGMDYWMVRTATNGESGGPAGPGINGGILKRMHPQHLPMNYVSVDSLDEYARKAEALGGQVVVPKTEVPTVGWFTIIKDTEGNVVGLWGK